ncbi:MAG TPA: hypothetical protein VK456_09505 [Xanthobacteraceae bacterium]|nr:hypothetical protein [Xanthobacteraceae bacterium]
MKVALQITKDGISLYSGAHEVTDADSFGKACAEAWYGLSRAQMEHESSIGALMEHLDAGVLAQLEGAHISIYRA